MKSSEGHPDLLYGVHPERVIEAIKARASNGDSRNDERKLGLVIEGGSVRAASSAGGAVVLAQLGYSNTFDNVYATSSGVMNAAYFISNQPLTGISVYFENCVSRRFVNPLRFWKIIDADYIFDKVAVDEKPLDTECVLASPSRLQVAALDCADGEGFMIDTKTSDTPLLQCLKASAAIPVFYNRAVEVDGRKCIDGGLRIPFPLKQAIEQGCTDILVMLTRPRGYLSQPSHFYKRLIFNIMCARGHRGLNQAFADRYKYSREYRDIAFGRVAASRNVNIATIATDEPETIQGLALSSDVLRHAALEYGRKTLEIFGYKNESWEIGRPTGPDS